MRLLPQEPVEGDLKNPVLCCAGGRGRGDGGVGCVLCVCRCAAMCWRKTCWFRERETVCRSRPSLLMSVGPPHKGKEGNRGREISRERARASEERRGGVCMCVRVYTCIRRNVSLLSRLMRLQGLESVKERKRGKVASEVCACVCVCVCLRLPPQEREPFTAYLNPPEPTFL